VQEQRDLLKKIRDFLERVPIEEGYCMCGDRVKDHNMGSGHSPVDEHEYWRMQLLEELLGVIDKR
jgi:hypothetical protein